MKSMINIAPWLLAISMIFVQPLTAAPNDPGSTALVKRLTSLMADRQLDVLAANDPSAPTRFVAGLLIPGAQLLVVSAQYPHPAELQSFLTERQYRHVYSALHQPSTTSSRQFFIDAGCDGFQGGGEGVDVLYEQGGAEMLFDGNWKKRGLSESAYEKKVKEAGAEYDRLVSLLIQALTPQAGGAAPAQ